MIRLMFDLSKLLQNLSTLYNYYATNDKINAYTYFLLIELFQKKIHTPDGWQDFLTPPLPLRFPPSVWISSNLMEALNLICNRC